VKIAENIDYNIDPPGRSEYDQIDRFTRDVADRWKKTSTELRLHFATIVDVHGAQVTFYNNCRRPRNSGYIFS
jgi:hypothetical protein